jgi:uridylate kinase
MSALKYKRVIVKLSGEALAGGVAYGIDPKVVSRIAEELCAGLNLGVEIGIVLGGGNLFRGAALSSAGLGRVTGDQMGMLATLMIVGKRFII